LLPRELPALQQLVHERVVLRQLLERAVPDEVRARVADVPDRHLGALDERDRHRRAHPRGRRIRGRALVDAAVRLLDQLRQPLGSGERARVRLLEGGGGELRRDLAGLRAAHAVGDGEERRRDDVRVLVVAPLPPRVGRACKGADAHRVRLRILEPELRLAHTHDVAVDELARAVDADAVDVRAVRRAEVVDPYAVAARLDADVAGRRVLVAVDRHVVLAAAADRERRRVELELGAAVEDAARRHAEPPGPDRLSDRSAGHRGPEDEALLRQPQVARGGADDPPDEGVEEDEERDLQREQHALVRGAADDHSRSVLNVISVEPTVNVSPGSSFARFTRRPFTSTPFVESRSTIQYVEPSCRSSAWRRETFGSSTWISHSRERPRSTRRLSTRSWRPSQASTATSRSTPSSAAEAASVGWGTPAFGL